MNREQFEKQYKHICDNKNKILSPITQTTILQDTIDYNDTIPRATFDGNHTVMIIIEEISELLFELTIPTPYDTGVLEELADVSIGLDMLRYIFNINNINENINKKQSSIHMHKNDIFSALLSLQKALTKSLRNDINRNLITAAMGQSFIAIENIKKQYRINNETLQIARSVKILRLENLINKRGMNT